MTRVTRGLTAVTGEGITGVTGEVMSVVAGATITIELRQTHYSAGSGVTVPGKARFHCRFANSRNRSR
jgi:uncharacterized protein YaiE (UPF0345 family)